MNETTAKLIEKLAAQMGTTTGYLWAILIKQAYVQGWINLITILMLFTFVVLSVKFFLPNLMKKIEECPSSSEPGYVFAAVILGILSCAALIAVPILIYETLPALLNPEYWALKQVLDAARGLR